MSMQVVSGGLVAVTTTSNKTTGTAFVEYSSGAHDVLVANLDASVPIFVKFGPSTGPDASNSTDAYPQLAVPGLSTVVFTRSETHTHWYAYAASTINIAVMAGYERK